MAKFVSVIIYCFRSKKMFLCKAAAKLRKIERKEKKNSLFLLFAEMK